MDEWTRQRLAVLRALEQPATAAALQRAVGTKSRNGLYNVLRSLYSFGLISDATSRATLTANGRDALEKGVIHGPRRSPETRPRTRYHRLAGHVVITVGGCSITCADPAEVPEAVDHARRWADRRTAVAP